MCIPNKYWIRPLQLVFESLVALGGFRRVTATQMAVYWTQMCSYVFMLHLLLRIGAKLHLYYVEISPNCAVNQRHIAVFVLLLVNVAPILYTAFPY